MNIQEKLKILADSAKYDASCSSSGSKRINKNGIGNASYSGICHSFSSDGRCISLLKILMTNCCIFDCKYCINRKSNNVKRAIFTPQEICELTINFYKRNYIEGLFLSSGIINSPDWTAEKLLETILLLRNKYKFNGYIHVKAIPGANRNLIKKIGSLVDRMSANIELPTNESLKLLAPNKNEKDINNIMQTIKNNKCKDFVPAGQSTQMIIGAAKETDFQIMKKSFYLYKNYNLKRVFYSAYVPVNNDKLLPNIITPPLLRENRLYQADWLLRFYKFSLNDLFDNYENFNVLLDPKTDWAIRHLDRFPLEVNNASFDELIKIPGIGLNSAKKILSSRKVWSLTFDDLKKMGISLKKAKYFITCNNKYYSEKYTINQSLIYANLINNEFRDKKTLHVQLSLFDEIKQ